MTFRISVPLTPAEREMRLEGVSFDKKRRDTRIEVSTHIADHMGNAERLELTIRCKHPVIGSLEAVVRIGGVDLDLVFDALAKTARFGPFVKNTKD